MAANTAAAVADNGSVWWATGLGVPGHPVAAATAAFVIAAALCWFGWDVPFPLNGHGIMLKLSKLSV